MPGRLSDLGAPSPADGFPRPSGVCTISPRCTHQAHLFFSVMPGAGFNCPNPGSLATADSVHAARCPPPFCPLRPSPEAAPSKEPSTSTSHCRPQRTRTRTEGHTRAPTFTRRHAVARPPTHTYLALTFAANGVAVLVRWGGLEGPAGPRAVVRTLAWGDSFLLKAGPPTASIFTGLIMGLPPGYPYYTHGRP